MIISFLYMFWTTMCPSSGETTVFMRHLVLVILYGWLSDGMQGGMDSFHPAYQTVIHTDRHVEKRKKHTKKNYAPSCLHLQDQLYVFVQLLIYKHNTYESDRCTH